MTISFVNATNWIHIELRSRNIFYARFLEINDNRKWILIYKIETFIKLIKNTTEIKLLKKYKKIITLMFTIEHTEYNRDIL